MLHTERKHISFQTASDKTCFSLSLLLLFLLFPFHCYRPEGIVTHPFDLSTDEYNGQSPVLNDPNNSDERESAIMESVRRKQNNKAIEIFTKVPRRVMNYSNRTIVTRHPSNVEQTIIPRNIPVRVKRFALTMASLSITSYDSRIYIETNSLCLAVLFSSFLSSDLCLCCVFCCVFLPNKHTLTVATRTE